MKGIMNILLVEDNDVDAFITEIYLKRVNTDCTVTRLMNGQEAIDFIKNSDKVKDIDLVLLDLNLPIVGGKEVLKSMRAIDDLKSLPVVVLSSSANPSDVVDCLIYTKKYVEKPVDEQKARKMLALSKGADVKLIDQHQD